MNDSDFSPKSPIGHVGQDAVQLCVEFPVRVQPMRVEVPVPLHNHSFTELAIVEGGSARHTDASGETQIGAGTVLVVPPGPSHAFPAVQNLEIVNIYYLSEWFLWDLNLLWQNEGLVPLFFAAHLFRRPEARRVALFTLDATELDLCRRELSDIQTESARATPSLFWIRGAFSKLLVTLGRAWRRQHPQLNDFDFRREIWRAMEVIDATIKDGELLHIEALSREVGQSSAHFSRLFRAATGLTPSGLLSTPPRPTRRASPVALGSFDRPDRGASGLRRLRPSITLF